MTQKIGGFYVIIDTQIPTCYPLLELAESVIAGGADVIQLRHKKEYSKEDFALANDLSLLCHLHSVPFIINDRCDIAIAVQANGVHLGQRDIPIKIAKELLGPRMIIGVTTENAAQAKQAEREGADYLGFGHIFSTQSKLKLNPPLGLQPLTEVCNSVKIPVIAIGGINKTNLQSVCTTKVGGVAVISAVCSSNDPESESRELKSLLNHYGH
jgi:thiamine-phosphate pyrophosphorylase